MIRLLRWGTFTILLLFIVGAAVGYPLLQEQFFASTTVSTLNFASVVSASISPVPPTAAQLITARPTQPALVIAYPTSTITATPLSPTAAVALATTSLLPTGNAVTITRRVLGPDAVTVASTRPNATSSVTASVRSSAVRSTQTPTATRSITASLGVAIPVTPATPTPTEAVDVAPASREKGAPPLAIPPLSVATRTSTPIVVAPPTAMAITVVTVTATVANVTPVVVTTVQLTPPLTTGVAISGPVANTNSPLYSGPDFDFSIVGQVVVGEPLTVIGLYTEGNWYLLVNGAWLPGTAVSNAPLALPLVFPTMTPVPTVTPTVTPTPPPTATPLGSPTVTPTPTSLDQPVCDCSGDTLDCLGNIFANRAQAQQCFEYCFRQTGRDIHLLDPNGNGVACENLPDALPGASAVVLPIAATNCDPNYTGACVPIVTTDLNCSDIPVKNFRVVGLDPHGFDGDGDGIACEE